MRLLFHFITAIIRRIRVGKTEKREKRKEKREKRKSKRKEARGKKQEERSTRKTFHNLETLNKNF
ncbi:MAG: hypothetical protein CFE24_10265 [Flavobacterium sp. BFFFF2]|nr:MAG: hypothetical protein CFE24_10265 [Flavobacterium sp. BFFFF2]